MDGRQGSGAGRGRCPILVRKHAISVMLLGSVLVWHRSGCAFAAAQPSIVAVMAAGGCDSGGSARDPSDVQGHSSAEPEGG